MTSGFVFRLAMDAIGTIGLELRDISGCTMDTHGVSAMSQKTVGLRIRIDPTLRREFLEVCKAIDRPAAQVLRDFMRGYVEQRPVLMQRTLFDTESKQE